MNKVIDVFIGNYGSGKTELSLNRALQYAQKGATALVDLDIVNTYFRSSEHKAMLEKQGIRVLSPTFAMTGVDLPVLPAEMMSVFIDQTQYVVLDVGGDPVGATALGGYREHLNRLSAGLTVYDVVNVRRPFTANSLDCLSLIDEMQQRSRQRVHALINNGNMARDTSADDLLAGQALLGEVSKASGLPVAYACGYETMLEAFEEALRSRGEAMLGEKWAIDTYMRPQWLNL